MLDYILSLIYPNVCGFCGNINKNCLCLECENMLSKKIICKIEKHYNKYFSEQLYLFKYEGDIRKYILDYKFNDKSYIYKSFAKIIIKNEKICRFLKKYDIIIPVPIHKKRKNERGYNQSELIAIDIAKELKNIVLEKDVIMKVKNTIAQSTLNKEERIINSKGIYEIKDAFKIKHKNVVILDDVYTTGSTANECSKILKLNGAKNIGILTLAKD